MLWTACLPFSSRVMIPTFIFGAWKLPQDSCCKLWIHNTASMSVSQTHQFQQSSFITWDLEHTSGHYSLTEFIRSCICLVLELIVCDIYIEYIQGNDGMLSQKWYFFEWITGRHFSQSCIVVLYPGFMVDSYL